MENNSAVREKILVVEDQNSIRVLLQKLLARRGSEVLVAISGEEGLEIARRERPALIIADVLMPHMDGFEFVRQLRVDPDIAQTKVIFYTGSFGESEAISLAAACGVSHVMDKTTESREILRIVDEVLGTATASNPAPVEVDFDKQHLRILTDKLSQKVGELERLNRDLEQRVTMRTAELAAANDRLLELNRMKDEFLAIVSHDLRSPLSGIVLEAETMIAQDEKIGAPKRIELLNQIAGCAAEQIVFVNDLLILARNEVGGEKFYPSILRLSEVAADSLRSVAFNAEAKGLHLELTVSDPEPLIEGDRQRLLQLFGNLLTNAIKFTPVNGRIRVEIADEEGGIGLRISDTGVGIPADRLTEVFERFNSRREVGTAGETGTGLGLAIARQVVEMHGGRISIESELGAGTTIIAHLPAAK